jgi:hypothetical protein
MDPGLYTFPSDYANECVKNIKGQCRGIPMDYSNLERQRPLVDPKLMDHLAERNPFGQTLAYVLLRFAEKSWERNYLLAFMPMEILKLQNTMCGSSALMGFFWGELEKPRYAYLSEHLVDGKHIELTPISDVLKTLINKGLILSIVMSSNNDGETALDYITALVSNKPKDKATVETILAKLD